MKSPTKIYLLRHGQTVWNTERRLQGHKDSALTTVGKHQARTSGAKLRRLVLDKFRIVSSPLGRCRETSEIVAGELQYPPNDIEYDDRLKEISFGDWEGQKLTDIHVNDAAAYSVRKKNRWDVPSPGGESYAMVADRLQSWISGLGAETLVVVSHGCAGRILRGTIEGLDHESIYKLDEAHDAIYLLEKSDVTRVD